MMRIRTMAAHLGRTTSYAMAAVALTAPVNAQAEQSIAFDIAGGTLQDALERYAEQAKVQLIYAPALVAGRKATALKGSFSASAALARLLAGTGIAVRTIDKGVLMLGLPDGSALTEPGIGMTDGPVARDPAVAANAQIVVTGTHIRGAPPVASPTRTISRADMQRNGYSSLAQALQALPGNFGGMATEQSALSFSDRSGNNTTLAAGVNLRGLGADATLVLVNGRRIAGAGLLGDFADISSIPMNAVERVELVADGASALYGSDAVAGVVNIILRKRIDGLESGARLGSVTDGHARELRLSQSAGTHWGSGSALIAYEFQKRKALLSADRAYARSADSRPFGGTDHRYPYSLPGNILGFTPTGGLGPAYAIPPGQDGTGLSPGDFLPGVTNLENSRSGSDLSPDQTRHSVYASVTQTLGDGIDLSLEGRYAHRAFDSRLAGYATILSITDANPFFVSPTGASSDLIGYAFTRELGATRTAGSAQSLGFTAAIDVDLGGGWKATGYGAWARQRDKTRTDRIANEYLLGEALGSMPDDPLSPYSPARDGYFNPYGNGTANSQRVLDAISGYYGGTTQSLVKTADVAADGALFALPGGDVRMAVGADYRHEGFESRGVNYVFSPVPEATAPVDYGRSVVAGYAELSVPLVGAGNARPGLHSLDISAAVRTERYGDFGTTTNPKLGLRWSPLAGVALRATWGTSFRAPNLQELQARADVSRAILRDAAGRSLVVLQRSGGNDGLMPERARSWTMGIDLEPAFLVGFAANVTAFRTVFDRRIDVPALRSFSRSLVDPTLAPFVRFVSPTTSSADRAFVEALLASVGNPGNQPVDTVSAVVDTRYVNTGKVDVAGVDVDLHYAFYRGENHFTLGLSASYLARWREQLTPTSAQVDRRNEVGRPVDLRGRLTAGWSRGPFDALLAMNYVDPYRDLAGKRIDAWATFDLRLAYAPKATGGPLAHMSVSLVAQNLFDRAPPFYDSTVGAGYDGANADATGRFVALEVSKRW